MLYKGVELTRWLVFAQAPPPIDVNEPKKVAEAVGKWGLDYVVCALLSSMNPLCITLACTPCLTQVSTYFIAMYVY